MSTSTIATGAAVDNRHNVDDRHSVTSETRPGLKTTEFMLTVIAAVAAIIASYASKSGQGSFPIRWGWLVAIIVVSAYVLSRGIAKSGVRSGRHYDDRD